MANRGSAVPGGASEEAKDDEIARGRDASPPRPLAEFQLTIPEIILGLRRLVSPVHGPGGQEVLNGGSLVLGSVATSQDPSAKAIRWGKQHLEQLADRVHGVGVPSLKLTLFRKVVHATSATAMLHYLCDAVCRMAVKVATDPALEGMDNETVATLGADLAPRDLQRIEKQAGVELALLAERDGTGFDGQKAENPPHPPAAKSGTNANEDRPPDPAAKRKLLVGWHAILEAMGVDQGRNSQVRVKRLNARRDGPIVWVGNRPKVYSGPLLDWVEGLSNTKDPNESADVAAELNHPAEMKRLGFQPKARPNNPGTLSKGSDEAP